VSAATVAVPRTGADPRDLEGLILVTAGSGCLGVASAMRRRRFGVVVPAGLSGGAWPVRRGGAGGWGLRLPGTGALDVLPPIPKRGAALSAVLAVGLLTAVTTGLAHAAAAEVGRASTAAAGLTRTAATKLERFVLLTRPPARFVPVDVSSALSSGSDVADLDLSKRAHPFPADGHSSVPH
jgi:hypothetical protein